VYRPWPEWNPAWSQGSMTPQNTRKGGGFT
jgi:hypothetical protein